MTDAQYHARERFARTFSRSFALPKGIDASKITAEFKEGVLEVRAPPPQTTQPQGKTIPIKR